MHGYETSDAAHVTGIYPSIRQNGRMPPPPVPWMTRTDRYILDLLDRAGVAITPTTVWRNLHREHGDDTPSQRQITRRLRDQLATHGLVTQPFEDAENYYELTELGERFLHDDDAETAEFIGGLDGE
jgi:DNA-binding PadR family transcriptional regulator